MGYFLTVISGPDEGKSCLVGQGEILIGRSPSAKLLLRDESVAWEHATVQELDGRLTIKNLSAAGTRLRGKRVSGEMRLSANDEIELSPACKVLVVQQDAVEQGTSPLVLALVAALALAVLGGGGAAWFFLMQPKPRPITDAHWRQGYTRLSERVERWQTERRVPIEVGALMRDAWRFEQIDNVRMANQRWERLASMLLTLRSREITGDDLTFAESASPTSKAMNVVMGWDTALRAGDVEWNSDDAYADALVWYARRRGDITRKLQEELERQAKANKGKKKK